MPNTPAAIGRGITVAVARRANAAQRDLAHRLLVATGTVEWIEDEALMDAVTAVSGSGPAYVFLLAEALAQAGVAAGLPQALAAKLARETVAGSGELLHRETLDAAVLRENVTSPGGTTAAALEVLMGKDGLAALMTAAVAAATKRVAGSCRLTRPCRTGLGTAVSASLHSSWCCRCGNNLAQRSFKALQEFGHGPQARPQIRREIRPLLSSAAGSGRGQRS